MGLMAVYEAIQVQLLQYVASTGAPLPSFGIGAKDVHNHNQKPRVSWQPMGGPVTKPTSRGAYVGSGMPISQAQFVDNPRPLWSRAFQTAAYVWGDSIDSTDALAGLLVAAIDAVVHGAYKVLHESWAISGDLDTGHVMYLVFEIQRPFVDQTTTTTQPTGAAVTPVFGSG